MRAPRALGDVQFFQDDDAAAFAQHEAVAARVEGAGGVFGVVVAAGHGAHVGEAGHGHRGDGRLGAAGDNHIGVAAQDDLVGVADGVGGGRAGGDGGLARPLRAQELATLPVPMLAIIMGMKKGLTRPMPPSSSLRVLLLQGRQAADAAADEDADALAVVVSDVQSGVFHAPSWRRRRRTGRSDPCAWTSLRSRYSSGSKPLTWAAMRVAMAEQSKSVTRPRRCTRRSGPSRYVLGADPERRDRPQAGDDDSSLLCHSSSYRLNASETESPPPEAGGLDGDDAGYFDFSSM